MEEMSRVVTDYSLTQNSVRDSMLDIHWKKLEKAAEREGGCWYSWQEGERPLVQLARGREATLKQRYSGCLGTGGDEEKPTTGERTGEMAR